MGRFTGFVIAAACWVAGLLVPSVVFGMVCSGNVAGNIDIYCQNTDGASEEVPCGETAFSTTTTPEGPDEPTCPDPNVSAVCTFNCGPESAFQRDIDAMVWAQWARELQALVGEECRAYALMPIGWQNDPTLPAKLFFTVGRRIHHIVLSWGRFYAEDAVLEGRFFEPALGSVGESPLWGGRIRNDRALLRKAGICIHQGGALLGSPYWEGGDGNGYKRFPVATLCGSRAAEAKPWDIYISTEERFEGLDVRPIVERLRELARRCHSELVCITPELADERRKLLATWAARE